MQGEDRRFKAQGQRHKAKRFNSNSLAPCALRPAPDSYTADGLFTKPSIYKE